MSYTKFSKEVTKWLKDNGLPCYGTANDSPEETKARLDAWMRGIKEILRQWITEKRYRELISCAHGGWYQDDVIFEPLAEHFVADVYKRQVFLSRILEKALADSGQNPAAHFLAGELLDFFSCILQCLRDGDEMEHAEPLPLFSDLLKEEYLWSEEYDEEEDEMRYELSLIHI